MLFKKTIFILLVSSGLTTLGMAQSLGSGCTYVRPEEEASTTTSSNIISAGFGTGGYYPYFGSSAVASPNFSLLYQNIFLKRILIGNISLGGLVSYKSIFSSYEDYNGMYNYKQRWDYYIVGSRLSYHINPFPANKMLELYAGAMVAYYITTFKFTTNDPNYTEPGDPGCSLITNNSPSFFAYSIYTGLRSWVTSHSSVWIEVGYGYTSIAFGLSYKIKS